MSQDIERARLAADVLNNPAYAEAHEAIEREIYSQWRDAKDAETREHLHRLQQTAKRFRQVLETAVSSGKVALQKQERRGLLARLS